MVTGVESHVRRCRQGSYRLNIKSKRQQYLDVSAITIDPWHTHKFLPEMGWATQSILSNSLWIEA